VANGLSEIWGQPVVVENKPGASTRIAAGFVVKAPADGYTLLSTFGTHTALKALFSDLNFDPIADFTAVARFVRTENVFVVNASSPYKTLRELTDAYKTSGLPLEYGHLGKGSAYHVWGMLLGRHAGIKMIPISYKGEALEMQDILGQHLKSGFNSMGTALPQIHAGLLRGLAVVAPSRSKVLPDVPTFAELGYPDLDHAGWLGMVARAKTPRPILEKINADVAKVLAEPKVANNLNNQGFVPDPATVNVFTRQLVEEGPMWERLFHDFGIKPQ